MGFVAHNAAADISIQRILNHCGMVESGDERLAENADAESLRMNHVPEQSVSPDAKPLPVVYEEH